MLSNHFEARLKVAEEHAAFVESALLRFGYLHPGINATQVGAEVLLTGADETLLAEAEKQFRYTLYREVLLDRFSKSRTEMYRRLFS